MMTVFQSAERTFWGVGTLHFSVIFGGVISRAQGGGSTKEGQSDTRTMQGAPLPYPKPVGHLSTLVSSSPVRH